MSTEMQMYQLIKPFYEELASNLVAFPLKPLVGL